MFQKDDLVIYGNTGVCRIEKIGKPKKISMADKTKLYYKLVPIYSSEIIYAPVDTPVFMRTIISADEANQLIDMIPEMQAEAYHNTNINMLKEHYQAAIRTHDCADLIELIMSMYAKKEYVEQQNRKFGQVDETYMKRAEDLLYGEFSAALGIPKDEVQQYITSRISPAMSEDESLTNP